MSDTKLELAGGQDQVGAAKEYYFARLGTLMVTRPKPESAAVVAAAIVQKLSEDSRIPGTIDVEDIDDFWSSWRGMFPANSSGANTVLTGEDGFASVEFSAPIVFTLRVAVQHQQSHHGTDQPPTDTYAVAWDGLTLLVVWKQKSRHLPLSGGHIAAKVITDAITAAGFGSYTQACSPGCDYVFLHTAMEVSADAASEKAEIEPAAGASNNRVRFTIGYDARGELEEMALFGLLSLRTSSGHFAEVKNVGRRILDIRNQIRADLSHLLAHNYAYASGRALSPVKRMKAARANRGWRKEGRQLMARLWLAMSNVDSLTERWLDSLRSLQDSRYDIGEMFLFGYDMRSDISEIEAIDLQRVVDAMNQVASTFDSRVLAVSTSLGALGGAVAGSVITVASQ